MQAAWAGSEGVIGCSQTPRSLIRPSARAPKQRALNASAGGEPARHTIDLSTSARRNGTFYCVLELLTVGRSKWWGSSARCQANGDYDATDVTRQRRNRFRWCRHQGQHLCAVTAGRDFVKVLDSYCQAIHEQAAPDDVTPRFHHHPRVERRRLSLPEQVLVTARGSPSGYL